MKFFMVKKIMIALTHFKILSIMILVACLTGFTSDIYTPSFSKMAEELSVSIDQIQITMTIFMLGVSISQLIYGPWSEIVGRRIPLLTGLIIMLIGSITCLYAPNINILLIGRFVQGTGAGACSSLWRSIFRDTFDSTQIAKYGGYLGIVMVFIVAGAPALGGYLEEYFRWQASFLAITIYSFITLLLTGFLFKETSVHHHKNRFSISFFKDAFKQLLTSPIFMGYGFCVFLTYGAFFSWFVMGSILLINNLSVAPTTFGLINLFLGGLAMAIGGFLNGKMVGRFGHHSMLRLGWGIIFSAGFLMMIWCFLYGQTLFSILFCIFIFLFGTTLIWPNSFAGAFAPFGTIAGCAGTLYSFMQLGGGVIISWVSSLLPTDNPYSLPLIFMVTSITAWVIFERVVLKKTKKVEY